MSDDMTTRLIIGRAERVDAATANRWIREGAAVRLYSDGRGQPWVGTETLDVEYYDSPSCLHAATADAPEIGYLHKHVFPGGETWDLDIEWSDRDWPDYDVHCAHCGDLIREGDDQL